MRLALDSRLVAITQRNQRRSPLLDAFILNTPRAVQSQGEDNPAHGYGKQADVIRHPPEASQLSAAAVPTECRNRLQCLPGTK